MNQTETASAPPSYTGHVRNGVVVLDDSIPLSEGQAVRVELLTPRYGVPSTDAERTEMLARMKQAFDTWDEEDSKLSDEEADRLHIALEQNRGLAFRTPKLE